MRDMTRNETIGLIALLTMVTALTGISVLHGAQAPPASGITFREAPALPPVTPPVRSGNTTGTNAPDSPDSTEIVVHVAGAVHKPGVYRLPVGARGEDALKAAGGPTPEANPDALNLAARLEDGSKLHIPTRNETPTSDVPIETSASRSGVGNDTSSAKRVSRGGAEAHRGGKPGKLTDPRQGQVNINTADATELQRLPGVGPAMAARILEFRKENGGFKSAEDLLLVSGIGPKKFEKMKPFVKVR